MARLIRIDGPIFLETQNRRRSHRHGLISLLRLPESICLVRRWRNCFRRTPPEASLKKLAAFLVMSQGQEGAVCSPAAKESVVRE
jgi:hypothetical protein